MSLKLESWGRFPKHPQVAHPVHWPADVESGLASISTLGSGGGIAYGKGRSYGDSCMAESDHVLAMDAMDRVLAVDWQTGRITAQAGLTLDALIRFALPRGWFLPVTPGTKFVTLGGAVANDVHGKNHHVMGTFGRHVRRLTMYRSSEGVVECSMQSNAPLFAATVGGLGLTGVLLSVELQLRRVASSRVAQRSIKFGDLDAFFELATQHDAQHEYAVAWVDCLATGSRAGRGHYIVGDHADDGNLEIASARPRRMPIDPPFSLVNTLSLRAFNALYYHRQRAMEASATVGYDPFFYPLDKVLHWNRIYGRAGFQQYQCVVPRAHAREAVRSVLREIARSGTGSFLAVLKQCGDIASPGLLSFPLPGTSLALDFAQHDRANERLFASLDAIVHEAGGRLYPAKDAHMSARHFRGAYPAWEQVEALRDPKLMSRFWRRVAG
ncbi:FAD-binding oxidoreductase [Variovorax sp. J31P207]|uniref:FAD-binding oxidoreductase n=1 Tax=Variovorax sp. J31P207 TaxID=3053510 RepID=UPI00257778D3|nr:FAD-binding oxidoreductase [Variovorax sp. J31P207]MDM0067667.1 FAD-binding oxidoreductase [Variovorax sp. J31P207]